MNCEFIATGVVHPTKGAEWSCVNPRATNPAEPCAQRAYGEFPPQCGFCKGSAATQAIVPDFMADMQCKHLLSIATREIKTGCCGGGSTAIEFGVCALRGECSMVGHLKSRSCYRCEERPAKKPQNISK